MRKLSILAIVVVGSGFASLQPSLAAGGMGDVSAHMRYMQEICAEQRRGEYPRDHDACLPDDLPTPQQQYQR